MIMYTARYLFNYERDAISEAKYMKNVTTFQGGSIVVVKNNEFVW